MTREEYEQLSLPRKEPGPAMVSALDGTTKTLIYGYDVDKFTHHVFQHENMLHVVVYDYDKNVIEHRQGTELHARSVVPNKRLYPERSDFAFLDNLKEMGVNFSMLAYNEDQVPAADVALHGFADIPELDEEAAPAMQMR